jgi:adenylate kinase family enzyme
MGSSGSGKSTGMRNLDENEVGIFNVEKHRYKKLKNSSGGDGCRIRQKRHNN